MATEIRDHHETVLRFENGHYGNTRVHVHVNDKDGSAFGCFLLGDLIAAVEKECGGKFVSADAIVIERSELPDVTWRADYAPGTYPTTNGVAPGDSYLFSHADANWNQARAHIAAALFQEAHLSVDQATVDALSEALTGHRDSGRSAYGILGVCECGKACDDFSEHFAEVIAARFDITRKDGA